MEDNQQLTNCTTSYARLPASLPIKKLGSHYKKIAGYVKLQSFTRLREFLVDKNADENQEVFIELEFKELAKNKLFVTGDVNQAVTIECQRCLSPMEYIIKSKISVVLIDTFSRMDKNLSAYEAIEFPTDGLIDLYQLVEDELILSLPGIVKHDESQLAECKSSVYII